MKVHSLILLLLALSVAAAAQQNRIVIDRPVAEPDTAARAFYYDEPNCRMVIDPAAMIYQLHVDSINQAAEAKIRDLITRLERKFNDPAVEAEVGRLIGTAVLEQQMALLDLQIERAVSLRDTLLLKGLELAIQELLANSVDLNAELRKQLQALERQFHAR